MSADDKMMENLKDQYRDIEIPEELRFRVESTILKAEKDMASTEKVDAGKSSRKVVSFQRFLRNFGITAAACFCALFVAANASPVSAKVLEKVPVLGAITKVLCLRTFTDETGDMEAKVDVPQVEGADAVNAEIQKYTDTIIAQYQSDVKAAGGDAKESVVVTYDTVTDNDKIFALRIDTTRTMADSGTTVKIYDVDKETGEIVTLKDLYRDDPDFLDKASENIKQQMREQMQADSEKIYFYDDDLDGFKKLTGDENFYFNEAGQLTIVFDEGQVAPMSMGVVEFSIPEA